MAVVLLLLHRKFAWELCFLFCSFSVSISSYKAQATEQALFRLYYLSVVLWIMYKYVEPSGDFIVALHSVVLPSFSVLTMDTIISCLLLYLLEFYKSQLLGPSSASCFPPFEFWVVCTAINSTKLCHSASVPSGDVWGDVTSSQSKHFKCWLANPITVYGW